MTANEQVSQALPPATGDRVLVIGAGIAGMAAAFRLRQVGFDVRVLEASDHVGGRMATIQHGDYRLDVGASYLSANYRRCWR